MRVSIWQQFSSNHSASFMVVGKFETPAEASNAADNIRAILQRLEKWRQDNDPTGAVWFDKIETGAATPIEHDLALEYDVDWPHGVNWFYWTWNKNDKQPVMAFDRYVVVENPFWEVRYTPQPFDNLLKRFGGEVSVSVSESLSHRDSSFLVRLAFTAPTEEVAQILEMQWQTYLSAPWGSLVVPPWLAYYEGHLDTRAEQLQFLTELYLSEYEDDSSVTNRLYHDIKIAENRQDYETAAQLKHRYYELYQRGKIHLTREEYWWAETALNATQLDKDIYEFDPGAFKITCNGAQLTIDHFLNWGNLIKLLAAITAWLQDQKCTDIDFTFTESEG